MDDICTGYHSARRLKDCRRLNACNYSKTFALSRLPCRQAPISAAAASQAGPEICMPIHKLRLDLFMHTLLEGQKASMYGHSIPRLCVWKRVSEDKLLALADTCGLVP